MAESDPFDLPDIYDPKFRITRDTALLTAGSCFAQHIGAALGDAGFNVIDTEPAPDGTPDAAQRRFGYGLYSARYGNIYTLRQLRQLVEEAAGVFTPAMPVWEREGRYFDAQRPGVEPDGLGAPGLVSEMRRRHLEAVASAFASADVVVYTLGLTEAWEHRVSGTVYPIAPGTIAGAYDPQTFALRNFGIEETLTDFARVHSYLSELNPDIHWLLTVSPVPLTATATDQHVLVASTQSKAILRTAAGMIAAEYDCVDYFPSYELVTNPAAAGRAFTDNLRNPTPEMIRAVMQCFMQAHGVEVATEPARTQGQDPDDICEEALLEAFRT
ncbi:GSCFA domain-containing protein [Aliiroseovarius sp. YM-037]|uniref:GSCFA domain-containing protein n=1 Tax=Aliiroseovarius sp. YM-037 TaxID=3341728 RepID=UPI003A7FBAD6